MKKTYRTALGKQVDMDILRLSNENTIAVGNMKVNARGDELGPGGEVARTRNEVMEEYYRLNGSTVNRTPVPANEAEAIQAALAQQEQRANQIRPRGAVARKILDDQEGTQ
jgi:hypothetical protein